ncbi:MAG TPA: histone H1 [Mucilaginibacter sp.]
MEKITTLKELIALAEADAKKFTEKDNRAAGTRLRKTMQEIKLTAQEIHAAVTEKKKAKA